MSERAMGSKAPSRERAGHPKAPSATSAVVLAWLPAALYMALIWTLSSFEIPELPMSGLPFRDKLVHTLEYAVLALFVAHACVRTWPSYPRSRVLALAVVITASWGVLDELHQALVPGRSSELADLAADLLGACIGVSAREALSRTRARIFPSTRAGAS